MLLKQYKFDKSDFSVLFDYPKVSKLGYCTVYYKQLNNSGTIKVAVMCKRSVKGAVQRNFSKRIVKSLMSSIIIENSLNGYLGVVVSKTLKQIPRKQIQTELSESLFKLVQVKERI